MARWRMSVTYLLARFWAAALGYALEPPPTGFVSWDDYRRDLGAPKADLATGADRIIDPDGGGPRIWFQVVPEPKTVKNRLHLDVHVSGGRAVPIQTRRQRVDAEARRLADLGATMVGVLSEEGIDHYAEPSRKPRKALDPQVLTIASSAPVTTQEGGGGSGCHRRRGVSAGGSPRLSAFH
jgi:hypothetical protein